MSKRLVVDNTYRIINEQERRIRALELRTRSPIRVVVELPTPGVTGDMVLFGGDVWVHNGVTWRRLAYA